MVAAGTGGVPAADLTAADYLHAPEGTRQRDPTPRVRYDRDYIEARYAAIDDRVADLAWRRVAVLDVLTSPQDGAGVLDFGCGTGRVVEEFLARGWLGRGHDLAYSGPDVDYGYGWHRGMFLPAAGALDPAGRPWHAVTFFDSLEHLPDPAACVRSLAPEWVMVSVPWCHRPQDWDWFGPWKHRRPGEHLHHWNRETLVAFFAGLGYAEVMSGCLEDDWRPNPTQREPNILTALFRRSPAGGPHGPQPPAEQAGGGGQG